MSNSKLLNDCLRGDRRAQRVFYETFAPQMFPVCLRYCRSREEAEEVLQEGFLLIFRNLGQYRGDGALEGWIRKIMVNASLQKIRSRPGLTPLLNSANEHPEIAEEAMALDRIGTKELIGLIQELPPMYRAVFNLYVFEGMKHREIAEMLNISEGTSKSNLSDARKILQRAVTQLNKIATPKHY